MTYVNKNYKRVSAETAYLTPEVLARPNLTVAINATVTRILFDKTTNLKPQAIGVEFGREEGGKTWEAFASKEVVLSYVNLNSFNYIHLTKLLEEVPSTHLT